MSTFTPSMWGAFPKPCSSTFELILVVPTLSVSSAVTSTNCIPNLFFRTFSRSLTLLRHPLCQPFVNLMAITAHLTFSSFNSLLVPTPWLPRNLLPFGLNTNLQDMAFTSANSLESLPSLLNSMIPLFPPFPPPSFTPPLPSFILLSPSHPHRIFPLFPDLLSSSPLRPSLKPRLPFGIGGGQKSLHLPFLLDTNTFIFYFGFFDLLLIP